VIGPLAWSAGSPVCQDQKARTQVTARFRSDFRGDKP
jgi:hypothetical protein